MIIWGTLGMSEINNKSRSHDGSEDDLILIILSEVDFEFNEVIL